MDYGQKKTIFVSVTTLCIALFVLVGVGYASFSTGLNINGRATAKSSSWKVRFDNLRPVQLTGTATELNAPRIVGDTSIQDFSVSLTTPGDEFSYTFDVVNEGTFTAWLNDVHVGDLTCKKKNGDPLETNSDGMTLCDNHVWYDIADSTGFIGVTLPFQLDPGQRETFTLKVTYGNAVTADELPKEDITISGLDVTLDYEQTERNLFD